MLVEAFTMESTIGCICLAAFSENAFPFSSCHDCTHVEDNSIADSFLFSAKCLKNCMDRCTVRWLPQQKSDSLSISKHRQSLISNQITGFVCKHLLNSVSLYTTQRLPQPPRVGYSIKRAHSCLSAINKAEYFSCYIDRVMTLKSGSVDLISSITDQRVIDAQSASFYGHT